MTFKLLLTSLWSYQNQSYPKWWLKLVWFLSIILIVVTILFLFNTADSNSSHPENSHVFEPWFMGEIRELFISFSQLFYAPAHLQLTKTWNTEIVKNISIIHFPSSSGNNPNSNNRGKERVGSKNFGSGDRSRNRDHRQLYSKTFIVYSEPSDACTRNLRKPSTELYHVAMPSRSNLQSKNAINDEDSSSSVEPNWILLADDTSCETRKKIQNAQLAGFAAIIIHTSSHHMNSILKNWSQYYLDYSKFVINVSFISNSDGHLIKDRYAYPKRYNVKLNPEWDFISASQQKLVDMINVIVRSWTRYSRNIREATDVDNFPKLFAYMILIFLISSPIILLNICPTRDSEDQPGSSRFSSQWNEHRYDNSWRERDWSEPDSSRKELRCRDLLGVSSSASREEITEAFRLHIRQYHPDKSPDKSSEVLEELTKKSQELIEARDFLLTLV